MARRPNVFLAFRITEPAIIGTVSKIQHEIAQQYPILKKSLTKLRKLHITLGVFHSTESSIPKLRNILDDWAVKGVPAIFNTPIHLTFSSCQTFAQGVLFVDAVKNEAYERATHLATELRELLVNEAGVSNFKKDFKLHLTLLKRPMCRKQFKLVAEKYVNAEAFFGQQEMQSIELLSMTQEDTQGYYFCLHEISTDRNRILPTRAPLAVYPKNSGKRNFSSVL